MESGKYKKLEQNIIDMIKEEQIKLGYRSETIRLYYPLESLNQLIGEQCNVEQMREKLKEFSEIEKEQLGAVVVSAKGKRFCLMIPPKGVDYIHECVKDSEFLVEFIRTIEKHGCTLEEIVQVFRKYSNKVQVEEMENSEFNNLIYFEDGIPDSYRYCLTFEGCHVTYHRFTIFDYESFQF